MFTFREEDGKAPMTWCLKFNTDTFGEWKSQFAIHLWEGKNKTRYGKVQEVERQYIQSAYEDVEMAEPDGEGVVDDVESDEEEEDSVTEEDDEQSQWSRSAGADRSKTNEQLAVGYKSDLSFVTRGNRIGVFAPADNKLQYRTTIDRIKSLNGREFSPTKVSHLSSVLAHRADDAAQSGRRHVVVGCFESELHHENGS